MADFSTILEPTNQTLDLYCKSVKQSSDAYASYSTVVQQVLVAPGTPTKINFQLADRIIFKNILPGGVGSAITYFDLINPGIYLIDFNVALELDATVGCQNEVNLIVNGVNGPFDVAFGYGNQYSYKGTIKSYVTKVPNQACRLEFRVATTGASLNHRYAQLSIVKVD